MDTIDDGCFDVEVVKEAVGSSIQAIRSILASLRKSSNLVTAYAKFTSVLLDVAKLNLSKEYRQMYNLDTRGMIVTIPGKPHDAIVSEVNIQFGDATYVANIRGTSWSLTTARIQGTVCSKEPDRQ